MLQQSKLFFTNILRITPVSHRLTTFKFFTSTSIKMSLPTTHKVNLIEENGESIDLVKYVDVPTPQIEGPTDVIVKNKYSGVNFIEAYFRKGIYPSQKPYVLGREATGVIAAIGKDVKKYQVGDKIAYLSGSTIAQYTKIPESHIQVKKLPASTTDEELKDQAAALLQGLTALSLIEEAYPVKKGDDILVWAAAGGVGKLLVQLVKRKGANVIAIASTEEKLSEAKTLGADYLINSSTTDDIAAKVKEITKGKGVEATFDSVGKDTFEASFELVARKGTFVSYGNASGAVPPFSIGRLSAKNIKIIRTSLFGYVSTQEEWDHYSTELARLISSGELKVDIFKVYPLSDYKQAATDLEGRKTTGKLVLEIPE